LFLVTNLVLSPQFLLWPIGLAAACLAVHPRRTTQRPAAIAVLVAAGLTQLVFPVGWKQLVHGSELVTSVLLARNVVLLAATILSCWPLLRASQPSASQSPPGSADSENREEIAQQRDRGGECHGQGSPGACVADERRSGSGRDEDRDQADRGADECDPVPRTDRPHEGADRGREQQQRDDGMNRQRSLTENRR
jgi:hypothetical protein